MVDEQEGCEWMNVSSGTGSPGWTRTKGRNGCVYVCVCIGVIVAVRFRKLVWKNTPWKFA